MHYTLNPTCPNSRYIGQFCNSADKCRSAELLCPKFFVPCAQPRARLHALLTPMHALVAADPAPCAVKSRHFRTPARPVCTLPPLARSARVCYTLTVGCKARPLWSAAVTSGTVPRGPPSFLYPWNARFTRLSGGFCYLPGSRPARRPAAAVRPLRPAGRKKGRSQNAPPQSQDK